MKSDLDRLMAGRGYAAIMVTGSSAHNPPMYYLANGARVTTDTVLVRKYRCRPVLFVNPMEREEAVCSGARVVSLTRYDWRAFLRQTGGDAARATARLYAALLADLKIRGRVAIFGRRDQGAAYRLVSIFNRLRCGVQLVGEYDRTLFDEAAATKDAAEADRIRAVGRRTAGVVDNIADYLSGHRAHRGFLVQPDGSRLTVGDVKRRISRLLAEAGLADVEGGVIFSVGRDAAVPHSRGRDRDPLALGRTIVFDIFPAEAGGGYFYDFTRTWCLGYAPPEAERLYADVLAVFGDVTAALRPGGLCRDYQRLACELFERRGHPTLLSRPRTVKGYVHSLGHGVGLRIHETPSFRDVPGNADRLQPGMVFTIEPGLYYPDRGCGVRIEDTFWLDPDTLKFEPLARYPRTLVLPIRER